MAINNPHDLHTYPYDFVETDTHIGRTEGESILAELQHIHTVLQAILKSALSPTYPQDMDERFVQPLYKVTAGGNWVPNRRGKSYIYVQAPVPTALSVTSPVGAPFILTIPSWQVGNSPWTLLDIPDQSSIQLDATATSNQMNLFVLITDVKM